MVKHKSVLVIFYLTSMMSLFMSTFPLIIKVLSFTISLVNIIICKRKLCNIFSFAYVLSVAI